ncbi:MULTISPECIES: CvpA family protein [Candidatus Ichthyocystis]|uniref:CvpA family protein n=1 Tax=Candidatus Ichthyocystis TaxID=2929841 RepID=UPI000B86500C|nr:MULTISPECIES: CvpA family protein [Ichthyocystis]
MSTEYLSSLSFLDWSFVVIFAISSWWGGYRGFVRDFFSLLGWFAAFWFLKWHSDSVVLWWNNQQLPQPKILVPVFAFLLSLLGFNTCGLFFSAVAKKAGMGVIDTVFGLFAGVFRGFIISFILIAFLQRTNFSDKVFFNKSVLREPIETTFNKFFPYFYGDIHEWMNGS